jgi:hypothetical protein
MSEHDASEPATERPDAELEPAPEPQDAPDEQPPATGIEAADEARRHLAELDTAPLEEHVGIYDEAHRRLQEGLADLDEG